MSQKSRETTYRIIGMMIPIVISFAAIAVQWGVVTTKLDSFQASINNLIKAKDKHSDMLRDVQQDVAFIKGKIIK